MLVEVEWDREKFGTEIQLAKHEFINAAVRAFDRMGLFIEAQAVQNAKVSTGRLAGSIHKEDAKRDPATGTISVVVGSDAAYALYVELGFQGHFVPFNVSEDLYYQALRQWGWRIPTLDQIPEGAKHVGKRWLIPRGRRRPVWGVYVKGTAQPFLAPALEELFKRDLYYTILREEFAKALAA